MRARSRHGSIHHHDVWHRRCGDTGYGSVTSPWQSHHGSIHHHDDSGVRSGKSHHGSIHHHDDSVPRCGEARL